MPGIFLSTSQVSRSWVFRMRKMPVTCFVRRVSRSCGASATSRASLCSLPLSSVSSEISPLFSSCWVVAVICSLSCSRSSAFRRISCT